MQTKNAISHHRPVNRHVISLGKANRLTKASFDGNQIEMIPERQYKLGG